MPNNGNGPIDAAELKVRAAGLWRGIIQDLCSLSGDRLDGSGHGPCPKCGGTDRFRAFDDFAERGGMFCNQCHDKKNSDGLASVMWLRDCSLPEAVAMVAEWLDGPRAAAEKPSRSPAKKPKAVHETLNRAAKALAWGMAQNNLLPEQRQPDHTWIYQNADGTEAGAVVRWNLPDNRKEVRQVTRVERGWVCAAMPSPRPLFALPSVIGADVVYVVEGEKAAEAGSGVGLVTTTPTQGSKSPRLTDWCPLDGKRVVILPDNDSDGRKFAESVVWLMRQQAPRAIVEVKYLKDDWPEIPEKGDLFDWSEHYDSSDVGPLQDKINRLPNRAAEICQASSEARRERTFAGRTVAELWPLADQPVDWLVEEVFSADQPTIFGAKQKSLKTTLLSDLAVCLSSGYPWLSRFKIPRKRRVLFITGEASESAAIRKIKRAADARNLTKADFEGFLRIEAVHFPTLPTLEDCVSIQRTVGLHEIEVVILDPLYMGLQGLNTTNLNEVGPAMRQYVEHCYPASVIVAHHVRKTATYDDAPNLDDLSQAGIAEFAGNYWLAGRIGEYTGDGFHALAIRYGGRDEQFGLLKLDFDERNWTADFSDLMGHREAVKASRESEKVNLFKSSIRESLAKERDGLSEHQIARVIGTQRHVRKFQIALSELERDGIIERLSDFKPQRSSAVTTGWRLAPEVAVVGERQHELDFDGEG